MGPGTMTNFGPLQTPDARHEPHAQPSRRSDAALAAPNTTFCSVVGTWGAQEMFPTATVAAKIKVVAHPHVHRLVFSSYSQLLPQTKLFACSCLQQKSNRSGS